MSCGISKAFSQPTKCIQSITKSCGSKILSTGCSGSTGSCGQFPGMLQGLTGIFSAGSKQTCNSGKPDIMELIQQLLSGCGILDKSSDNEFGSILGLLNSISANSGCNSAKKCGLLA